jgi:hypothetical protein
MAWMSDGINTAHWTYALHSVLQYSPLLHKLHLEQRTATSGSQNYGGP